ARLDQPPAVAAGRREAPGRRLVAAAGWPRAAAADLHAARDQVQLHSARAMRRRAAFWFAYGALLLVTLLAGIEGIAWLVTPAWPGYLLRPAPVGVDAVAQWSGGMPDVVFATNRWLMRDRERSVAKPANVAFRSLFVGDSFLEGGFTRAAL